MPEGVTSGLWLALRKNRDTIASPEMDAPLILVADDNLDAREMYCMYLAHTGFHCLECSTGLDAIAQAKAHGPALILMDATMPGMDGWEATRQLRADPQTAAIPVVMLTAHAFSEHRERSFESGAVEFLPKPILPDQLAAAVRAILAKRDG